jgi:hypothetical protein
MSAAGRAEPLQLSHFRSLPPGAMAVRGVPLVPGIGDAPGAGTALPACEAPTVYVKLAEPE